MLDSTKEFKYKKLLYMIDNQELSKFAEFILEDTVDLYEEVQSLESERVQRQIFKRVTVKAFVVTSQNDKKFPNFQRGVTTKAIKFI